ncbi:MAG TPA: response regulator transcription factor [Gaiellales bacterium]|nr:response regulator transcription factor [Gaiellales bacterium]
MTDDEQRMRILLVDDHRVVRAGLRMVLEAEADLEVVDEAGDVRDAVFKTRRHTPDLIVLDVMLPDGDGDEAIGKLLVEAPDAKVLILSMEDTGHHVRRAFANGANGYVLKDAAEEELVSAIREVAAGGRYLHPALGAKMVQADIDERERAAADPLSDREREVLRLLAEGHTNQEIAAQLYISVRTAETHRAHIMQKLRFTTRSELVRYAIDQGMLERG